jgi:hypothetical protein
VADLDLEKLRELDESMKVGTPQHRAWATQTLGYYLAARVPTILSLADRLREAEAERDAANHGWDACTWNLQGWQRDAEHLKKALARYGKHDDDCKYGMPIGLRAPCSCGLNAALSSPLPSGEPQIVDMSPIVESIKRTVARGEPGGKDERGAKLMLKMVCTKTGYAICESNGDVLAEFDIMRGQPIYRHALNDPKLPEVASLFLQGVMSAIALAPSEQDVERVARAIDPDIWSSETLARKERGSQESIRVHAEAMSESLKRARAAIAAMSK